MNSTVTKHLLPKHRISLHTKHVMTPNAPLIKYHTCHDTKCTPNKTRPRGVQLWSHQRQHTAHMAEPGLSTRGHTELSERAGAHGLPLAFSHGKYTTSRPPSPQETAKQNGGAHNGSRDFFVPSSADRNQTNAQNTHFQ